MSNVPNTNLQYDYKRIFKLFAIITTTPKIAPILEFTRVLHEVISIAKAESRILPPFYYFISINLFERWINKSIGS